MLVHKLNKNVSCRIVGWAKVFLLCLLLPCLGVYADPWEAWSGHIHSEYNGPWKWTESNVKNITVDSSTRLITCDATITGYTGSKTDLVIPEKITSTYTFEGDGISIHITYEATVKSIGPGAFDDRTDLIGVTIPDTVVEICDGYCHYFPPHGAFANCRNLTSVTIGNNVTNIGNYAFYGCSSLQSVTLPSAVKRIGGGAFMCCSNLADITIPDNVTSVETAVGYEYSADGAFYGCSSLTNAIIGRGVRRIPANMFSDCRSMVSVTIPNSVTNIEAGAFCGCNSLLSVNIPDSVKAINVKGGDYINVGGAFHGCSSIKSVIVPQCVLDRTIGGIFFSYQSITNVAYSGIVTNICVHAFSGCTSLSSVTIPSGVTSIGDYAFNGCNNLTDVMLPNSVTSIGGYAFNGCNNLTDVMLPNSVTSIEGYAFNGCNSLANVTIPDSVMSIGDRVFYGCGNIISATVPQSVMSKGLMNEFYSSYQKLRSLRLGANVTAIGANEFNNCRALTSVTVADGNTSYVVLADGCLYDIARNLLLFCPRDKASITIPNGVTSVGNYAFQYCTNLVSASIPETVQSIGTYSFYGCPKVSGLTIPNSLQTLSTTAFDGCDVLWTEWYRALANLSVSGGVSSGGGNSGAVDPRYVLTVSAADRAIASVAVNGDCSIDQFVLTNSKVYDTVLRIVNTSGNEVHLTLPSGYTYETFRGARPLTIPANSRNMLTITRTAADTFLVSREVLETVQ